MVFTTILVENGVTVPFRPVHVHKLPDADSRWGHWAAGPLGHWAAGDHCRGCSGRWATGPATRAVALAAGPLGCRCLILLYL